MFKCVILTHKLWNNNTANTVNRLSNERIATSKRNNVLSSEKNFKSHKKCLNIIMLWLEVAAAKLKQLTIQESITK